MKPTSMLLLASKSPQRRTLLRQLGVTFDTVDIDTPEQIDPTLCAEQNTLNIAATKAHVAHQSYPGRKILTADTLVVIDEHILGKPKDQTDAMRMLCLLSGKNHRVLSAVALIDPQGTLNTVLCVSKVRFKSLSEREIVDYWQTGEPLDRAGAYAIQGRAGAFIERIEGSYSGIMGLPLFETAQLLGV